MVTSDATTPDESIASLPEDLPLDVIGETIARVELDRFVAHFESARGSSRRTRSAAHA